MGVVKIDPEDHGKVVPAIEEKHRNRVVETNIRVDPADTDDELSQLGFFEEDMNNAILGKTDGADEDEDDENPKDEREQDGD